MCFEICLGIGDNVGDEHTLLPCQCNSVFIVFSDWDLMVIGFG